MKKHGAWKREVKGKGGDFVRTLAFSAEFMAVDVLIREFKFVGVDFFAWA